MCNYVVKVSTFTNYNFFLCLIVVSLHGLDFHDQVMLACQSGIHTC